MATPATALSSRKNFVYGEKLRFFGSSLNHDPIPSTIQGKSATEKDGKNPEQASSNAAGDHLVESIGLHVILFRRTLRSKLCKRVSKKKQERVSAMRTRLSTHNPGASLEAFLLGDHLRDAPSRG